MSVKIEKYFFDGNGRVPNSRLPLLIYRKVIQWEVLEMEAIMRQNHWLPDWRAHEGMWPRHHFHCEAHEIICVTRGAHVVKLGGHDGVYGKLTKGDVVVIPAGVGHCGIQISDDLDLTGGFAEGQSVVDFRMGYPEDYPDLLVRAAQIPVPSHDPFFGAAGPLARIWAAADRGERDAAPEYHDIADLSIAAA